jgi:anti-sigma B factor antagonist
LEGFDLSRQARDGVLIIKLGGDLDIVTSRQLDDVLVTGRREHSQVVLELSGVDFMDTSSLAVIVGHWKGLTDEGGSLALAGARYQYTKSLWITGLASRIPMYDNVDLAIAAARPAAASGAD